MNKDAVFILIMIGAFLIIAAGIYLVIWEKNQRMEDQNQICFQDDCLEVEVFNTPYSLSKGFQGRVTLPQSKAGLFVFKEEGVHSLWMKDMLISLDMVWVNKTSHVIHIHHNVTPCKEKPCEKYRPPSPVTHAVELNSGWCREHNITGGMKVSLPTTEFRS